MKKKLLLALLGLYSLHAHTQTEVQKVSYRNMIASYLWFVKNDTQVAYDQKEQSAYAEMIKGHYPHAKQTYNHLNNEDDFAVSYGTAMSQAKPCNNSILPERVRKSLQRAMTTIAAAPGYVQKAKAWIQGSTPTERAHNWIKEERNWYALRAARPIFCNDCCRETNPERLTPQNDQATINATLKIMAENLSARELEINACPHCQSLDVTQLQKQTVPFTQAHFNAMLQQAQHLGVLNQRGVKNGTRPTYRLSIEQADVMNEQGELDQNKIDELSKNLSLFKNPLLFMQHYGKYRDDQFEYPEDIKQFADYAAAIIKANPDITHVCPISQPMALAFRSGDRQSLPPFGCKNQDQYFENIVQAQIAACEAMKKENPNITTLLSHQYKPFKVKSGLSWSDAAKAKIATFFAHKMYNQKFINAFKSKQDSFDALALSIYPALQFEGFKPAGDNCSGKLDPQAALESIIEMHKAFPNKDIYIVETGCNSQDPTTKKQFVDMTLHACKLARDLGAPVKGCYFWGHTNDKDYYTEWNSEPGSTYFAPYDQLDIENPTNSINEYGQYLQEILL